MRQYTPRKKIIWLASYPKSGNTWFRAFLTALYNNGEVDINNLDTDGIFSSRQLLLEETDVDSTLLTDREVKTLLPEVFNSISSHYEKEKLYFKIHDAYGYNELGYPIIPTESTSCAIYILRNPLDIASSLANHNNTSIDKAIELMNNKEANFAYQKNNHNVTFQARQLISDWSSHVLSWLNVFDFPVHFIRYEDLKSAPFKYFKEIIQKINSDVSDQEIRIAIEASNFMNLKEQENTSGFNEKTLKSKVFFRSGELDKWKSELNKEQISTILFHHREVMSMFKYI